MNNNQSTELLFELSRPGRRCHRLPARDVPGDRPLSELVPAEHLAEEPPPLPELGELDLVRHYTNLSARNMSIDTNFYPLGSCTMKYNPKRHERLAALPGFAELHPLQSDDACQGMLELLYEMQQYLAEISGLPAVSLQPAAGAQGELTALFVAAAYFRDLGQAQRRKVLVPDSAHGTNPASAALAGFEAVTVKSNARGLVDLDDLRAKLGADTAAFMITNPNTLGLFEPQIRAIADLLHEKGALLYLDGANMNAILGMARPGDFGADMQHYNVHKTFTGPHGGGGPGSGPIAVRDFLAPYLPVPIVALRAGSGQRAEGSAEGAVGSMQRAVGSAEGAVGSGQRAEGSAEEEVGSGQRAEGSEEGAVGSGQRAEGCAENEGTEVLASSAFSSLPTAHCPLPTAHCPLPASSPLPTAYCPLPTFYLNYDVPKSIGRVRSFFGNVGILLRGYAYIRTLGPEGLRRVSENAVLNANYLRARVKDAWEVPHEGPCMHEFVASGRRLLRERKVRTLDVAKRLLDYGFHSPTVYFPLVVAEALMMEPTETESKSTLDAFADALLAIKDEEAETLRTAPHRLPISRPDEVRAAKEPMLRWIG